MKDLFQSKFFKWLMVFLAALIIILLVFQLGMSIGFKKARYSYNLSDNYFNQIFGVPRGGMLKEIAGNEFLNPHGTAGTIVRINNSSLIIKSQENVEKAVNVIPDTSIKKGRIEIPFSQLQLNDFVTIIGSPKDDGSVEAKIIRVMGPPPNQGSFIPPVLFRSKN